MHYLTRRFEFSASHYLASAALSAEEAKAAYGMCENIHGHNYRLEVTVRGEPDPRSGFFANVMDIKQLVDDAIVDPCEHACLNDLPLFKDAITTMEGLADRMWQVLQPLFTERGFDLYEILLAETDDNVVRLRQE